MIYSRDQKEIFARICHFFDSMQYNIVQAKIYTLWQRLFQPL